jgi:hypothetical protein
LKQPCAHRSVTEIVTMKLRTLALPVITLAVLAGPGSADETLPDNHTSTWDNTIGVSPKNQAVPGTHRYQFTGTLRDGPGNPIGNFPAAQIKLDFGGCLNPSTRTASQIRADADTDANGFVIWSLNLDFGGGDPCGARVLVQNVVFKTLAAHIGLPNASLDGGVRSPDENGDGLIGLADLGIFQTEFVNTGTRLDYRGDLAQANGAFDGLTTLTDLAFFQAHFVAP